MSTRLITAMFNTRDDAERAADVLARELSVDRSAVRISAGASTAATTTTAATGDKGFFESLKDLFLPDEDRYAYAEGLRRGGVLLSVNVEDSRVSQASDLLERAGAVDLDAQEAEWRQSGWTGYDAGTRPVADTQVGTSANTDAGATTNANAALNEQDTLKVVQERLVVGKREVETGRVRIRSYVIERPVEEQVRLHEETVRVERRPVDRPATPADLDAFQERTIEARATAEEAVVAKEARVVEEIGIRREAADRAETVRDTVRETRVDVEDNADLSRTTGTGATLGGTTATTDTTTSGTGVLGSVDRTLNTNVSGTNPAADAPDGTAGNPPGTMASRAGDKTLGTNISGANPDRR